MAELPDMTVHSQPAWPAFQTASVAAMSLAWSCTGCTCQHWLAVASDLAPVACPVPLCTVGALLGRSRRFGAQGRQRLLAVLGQDRPCLALRLALPAQSMHPPRQHRRRISPRVKVSVARLWGETTRSPCTQAIPLGSQAGAISAAHWPSQSWSCINTPCLQGPWQ